MNAKYPRESKTFRALMALLLWVLKDQFGVEITQEEIGPVVDAVGSAILALAALYGRVRADKPLTLRK